MNRFAALLDRIAFEPSRNGKIALMQDYFAKAADPDRGYALAAFSGALNLNNAKPAIIRTLISERTDPVLFAMSYDYVGDLSETVALLWPGSGRTETVQALSLGEIITTLSGASKSDLPGMLAGMLDRLDENGRWALLKLITGGLRIGVSARLAKTALAANANQPVNAIEEIWPGLEPPYAGLFQWIDGNGPRPANTSPLAFKPVMLAHPLQEKDLEKLNADDFAAEWKWDGIRVQTSVAIEEDGKAVRLYTRNGDDITGSFPDVAQSLLRGASQSFCVDGELLIVRDGSVAGFADLQKRLNRKTVSAKMQKDFPAHIKAYDLLTLQGDDIRAQSFTRRRAHLEDWAGTIDSDRISLSPLLSQSDWQTLREARSNPENVISKPDAKAVEGLMLKKKSSSYVAGRPKGLWYKWKRDPYLIDAVLLYAQRGHGRRSSFYSDYTFGVWRVGDTGDELVPVGKAYFGFTDEELKKIDQYVRKNTLQRFGPVSEVKANKESGLVFEVAFEGLQRSSRHKSGLAMRFPRVSRIRWDKPSAEADHIETLQALLD